MSETLSNPVQENPAVSLVEKILAEGPIGMQAAARLLGTFRAGSATHPSTIARWCKGVRLPDGQLLRLEHIHTSGRICTSRPALIRFLAAQQGPQGEPNPQPVPRSPAARTRAHAKASAELDRLGVK